MTKSDKDKLYNKVMPFAFAGAALFMILLGWAIWYHPILLLYIPIGIAVVLVVGLITMLIADGITNLIVAFVDWRKENT